MTVDSSPSSSSKPRHHWSWPRFFRNAALITLAIIGASVLYYKQIRPSFVPRNFGVIVEGKLYRSGLPTPAGAERTAREHSLRSVIDLGTFPLDTQGQRRLEATYHALGLKYFRLPLIGDGTGDPNLYASALRLMTNPELQPILIHCGSGAQRTSGLTTLYRHLVEGVPLDEAYAESLQYWHDPEDNPHLKPMLDRWAKAIQTAYDEGGLIPYNGPTRPLGKHTVLPFGSLVVPESDPEN